MPAISELIARAQAGDEQAMEQIICAYQRPVATIVISIIGNDGDWEDICQQIFLKMVRGLGRLKNVALFEPWLFRIARNASLDHLRRRRTRRFLVPWQQSHDSIADGTPEHDVDQGAAALETVISRLPPDDRHLMMLVGDRRWDYSRIGAMTGRSVSAIKSRVFRLRRRLRRLVLDA
jgi:RNA polymerase sigma-70 factor, ECF subfamily